MMLRVNDIDQWLAFIQFDNVFYRYEIWYCDLSVLQKLNENKHYKNSPVRI